MKKYLYILMVALGAIAVSCQKEQDQNENPDPTPASSTVIKLLGAGDTAVKALIEDQQGSLWQAGDKVQFLYFHAGDADAYWSTDYELQASDITDGNVATYRGNLDAGTLLGVFRYNNSGNTEFYFAESDKLAKDTYTFTQAEAGRMEASQFHLHSGLAPVSIDNSGDADELEVPMNIAGTVMRLLPYTETYNDETIQSVSFSSSDFITGVVRYHYGNSGYDSVKDVNWAMAKAVKVNLGTPCSLGGMTSRENSKGIYFALPATESGVSSIPDYEIVVTTDKAAYHFANTTGLELGENTVRNIFLKLENAEREDLTAIKGSYWFDGNLAGSYTGNALDYGSEAQDIADLGYWVVYSMDSAEGSPVVAREPADYPDFYTQTTLSIVDVATNAAPDWLQFGYTAGYANSHLWIKLTENTGDDKRQAVITFNYPEVACQYQLRANEPKKVITVTQEGQVAEEKPLFKYTFSGSGWNGSWSAQGRTLNFEAAGYTRQASDDWLAPYGIVIAPDLQKLNAENNYVAYTPGAAYPAEDVAPFVKQALGLTDEQYEAAAAWLTFGVHVEGAQWLIRIDGVTENTGAARTLSGNILNPDGSVFSPYTINQAAGSGSSGEGGEIPSGSYTWIIDKASADPDGTILGFRAGATPGVYIRIKDVKQGGVTIDYTQDTVVEDVIGQVFKFTAGEWNSHPDYHYAEGAIIAKKVSADSINGIQVGFYGETSWTRALATWYNSDGSVSGYFKVVIN